MAFGHNFFRGLKTVLRVNFLKKPNIFLAMGSFENAEPEKKFFPESKRSSQKSKIKIFSAMNVCAVARNIWDYQEPKNFPSIFACSDYAKKFRIKKSSSKFSRKRRKRETILSSLKPTGPRLFAQLIRCS